MAHTSDDVTALHKDDMKVDLSSHEKDQPYLQNKTL